MSNKGSAELMYHMFELWHEASEEVLEAARSALAIDGFNDTHPTALEWNFRQVLQHVLHLESDVLRWAIKDASNYAFKTLREYLENGMRSLALFPIERIVSELNHVHDHRPAYLRSLPKAVIESEQERQHWIEVAQDRVLDLWVHYVDLSRSAGLQIRYSTGAAQYVLKHLVDGAWDRADHLPIPGQIVALIEQDETGSHIRVPLKRTVRAAAEISMISTLQLTRDSFIELSTGRAHQDSFAEGASGVIHQRAPELRVALNQFVKPNRKKAPMPAEAAPHADRTELDTRVAALVRSPHTRPEDVDMLRAAQLGSVDELRSIVGFYEQAYAAM